MIDKKIKKNECCGCSACNNICPLECITMKSDSEGFWYPEVDYAKCIKCQKCIKVCPAVNKPSTENTLKNAQVVAAYSKNEEIRINSTSGGMFSEIAKYILNNKGKVFGARYNENHLVEHCKIEDISQIQILRQSKYLQSDILKTFKEAKEELNIGNIVLFAGTPCHIAALKNFLGKDYENLLTIDFLCRGVISPDVYKQYLKSLEKKYKSKIKKVIFKNKTFGWHRFSTKVIFENGEEYIKDRYTDSYMRGYLEGNLYLRPSCYECQYKTLPRYSDITLGDFWGIEKIKKHLDQDKGTSIFMINTNKGKEVFEKIKENLIFEEMKLEDIYLGNIALTEKTAYPDLNKKEEFFKNYLKEDFENLVEKLLKKNLAEKTKSVLIKVLKKLKVL